MINVKENTPDLVCRVLSLVTREDVETCDYFRFILARGITSRVVIANGICAL